MKIFKCTVFLLLGLMLYSCSDNSGGFESPTTDMSAAVTETEEITTTEGIIKMESKSESIAKSEPESLYYKFADDAVKNLLANYWNEDKNLFYDQYPDKNSSVLNYWWYAHGIDVLADAYIRTKDEEYIKYADKVLESVIERNRSIINDYYDDMEWMALALLRFYNETGDGKYLEHVNKLWKDIKWGWNDTMGGGIAWRKEQRSYKNTPANAPAAILAARLYNVTNDPDDLEWAVKIYDFVKNTLVDAETGQVWDGINREGNGKIDKSWNFTYCHGVYIGAGVELYRITGDEVYLDDAKKTAEYALGKFVDKNGVFVPEVKDGDSGGDGGLFKGIMIRYLAELYKTAPDMTGIEEAVTANADVLTAWGTNDKGNFAPTFDKPPKDGEGYDLSVQLSGCMLLEMAALLNP